MNTDFIVSFWTIHCCVNSFDSISRLMIINDKQNCFQSLTSDLFIRVKVFGLKVESKRPLKSLCLMFYTVLDTGFNLLLNRQYYGALHKLCDIKK